MTKRSNRKKNDRAKTSEETYEIDFLRLARSTVERENPGTVCLPAAELHRLLAETQGEAHEMGDHALFGRWIDQLAAGCRRELRTDRAGEMAHAIMDGFEHNGKTIAGLAFEWLEAIDDLNSSRRTAESENEEASDNRFLKILRSQQREAARRNEIKPLADFVATAQMGCSLSSLVVLPQGAFSGSQIREALSIFRQEHPEYFDLAA